MATTAFDPYAVLGIPRTATRAEAARAHRRLAKAAHPDLNPGPAAAQRMRRINEAWRILSDPSRRARHDADTGVAPGAAAGGRAGASTTSSTWTTWTHATGPGPRARRPARPPAPEPSIGDHPAVFVGVWVLFASLVFIGSYLGSLSP